MIDLARVSEQTLNYIEPIIQELTEKTGIDPDRILLVGAICRDLLHSSLGHTFEVRSTTDADIGIWLDDWEVSEKIRTAFTKIGHNGIRYQIAGIPVDIMPFGGIEDPEGISLPRDRGEDLVVFAFQDVHQQALKLSLPKGATIRLPQPAGYATLKMRAIIDRHSHYDHDKHLKDLALVIYWYQKSKRVDDLLYDTEAGIQLLCASEMDSNLAAVKVLSNEIILQLSKENHSDLAEKWSQLDLDKLAKYLLLPLSLNTQYPHEVRVAYLEALNLRMP